MKLCTPPLDGAFDQLSPNPTLSTIRPGKDPPVLPTSNAPARLGGAIAWDRLVDDNPFALLHSFQSELVVRFGSANPPTSMFEYLGLGYAIDVAVNRLRDLVSQSKINSQSDLHLVEQITTVIPNAWCAFNPSLKRARTQNELEDIGAFFDSYLELSDGMDRLAQTVVSTTSNGSPRPPRFAVTHPTALRAASRTRGPREELRVASRSRVGPQSATQRHAGTELPKQKRHQEENHVNAPNWVYELFRQQQQKLLCRLWGHDFVPAAELMTQLRFKEPDGLRRRVTATNQGLTEKASDIGEQLEVSRQTRDGVVGYRIRHVGT